MEIYEEVDQIIEEIKGAKPVPFSSSAMINREVLLGRLERLRRNIPEEVNQARYVMQDREETLDRVQQECEELVAQAQAERERMLGETEVALAAKRQAGRIMEGAKQRAEELKSEAEDYVDARLASFEVVLQKTLAVVHKGRESLKGRLDVAGQRVPLDEPGDPLDSGPDTTGNVRLRPQ